jgi:hypothetical protein
MSGNATTAGDARHVARIRRAMVLAPNVSSYGAFDESFSHLFNSYYEC